MDYLVETGLTHKMSLIQEEDFECDLLLEKVNPRVWLDSWVSSFFLNGVDLVSLFWHYAIQDLRPVKYRTQMFMYVMRCECMSLWCLMQGSNCWVLLVIKEWLNRVIFRILLHCVPSVLLDAILWIFFLYFLPHFWGRLLIDFYLKMWSKKYKKRVKVSIWSKASDNTEGNTMVRKRKDYLIQPFPDDK